MKGQHNFTKQIILGSLMARIAHDMNNKMTNMQGYIQLLKKTELDKKQVKFMDIIEADGLDLKRIVAALLSFTRTDPEMKQADIAVCLEHVYMLFRDEFKRTGISYRAKISPELPLLALNSNDAEFLYALAFAFMLAIQNEQKQSMMVSVSDGDETGFLSCEVVFDYQGNVVYSPVYALTLQDKLKRDLVNSIQGFVQAYKGTMEVILIDEEPCGIACTIPIANV